MSENTEQAETKTGLIHCKHNKLYAISDLKERFHPKNRNKHPEGQLERLAKILNYQGARKAAVVSLLSGYLTAGHGRVLAAEKAGWTHFPVDLQEYETEAQEYADLQADNAVALWAELDLAGISSDIGGLGPDFDIDLLGLKNFKIDVLDPAGDDSGGTSVPANPKTRLGDIYVLGEHRLMCGDSTVVTDVERLMAGELADLVFTDPPYGVDYDGGHAEKGKRREKLANDDSTEIYNGSVPMMSAFSKPTAALYLWFAATKSLQVLQVLQVLQENNYEIRSWLIWNKNMAQFGAIGAQYKQKHEPCLYAYKKGNSPFWDGPNNEVSVWDVDRASKNEFHPTQKPTELSERAITNSCPEKGIVLDLFGGSGSTLIGCQRKGRSARLMELNPAYCDVIVSRWEAFTGQKAELLDGASAEGS